LFVVLGVAAGAAKLLGLTLQQTGDALAIAVSSNIASRQTRSGELSMWKGCATASAARAGVFAAMLAAEGMTGPTAAFEGKHGIRDQVSGPFDLAALGDNGNGYGIERTSLKFFPSEYHSQAPLALALQLREKVALTDIEAVGVQTYHTCYSEIGSEPEKWNPQTRETADHSLPYLLALALTDGTIGTDSFSAEKMRNPALRQLMQRIRIAEDPAYTREYPARLITQIAIVTRSGQRFVDTASYARGHAKNPMSDAEIDLKFNRLAEMLLSAQRRAVLLQQLREIDSCADIGTVVDNMRAGQ
jgi:2-methylcitrate dehydratase